MRYTTEDEKRHTLGTHGRFGITSEFDNGSRQAAVDLHTADGGEARARARRLSLRPGYVGVQCFDVLAHPGKPQLWEYRDGKLVRTEGH